jgi:hypothetical protein
MTSRAALLVLLLVASPARAASDAPEIVQPAPCVVKGTLVENATIYDLAKGGQPLAELTGSARWVQVSEFAPRAQRLRLVSGKSTPTLRFEGFVDVAAMPIGLTKDASIAGNMLAIRATVPLRVVEVNGVVMAEPRKPSFENTEANVACTELQVVREKAAPNPQPGGSTFIPLQKSLDLFGGPGGTALATLRVAGTLSSVTLNGYETKNGYIHVRFAEDVVIDGWMRRSDLTEMSTGGIGSSIGIGGIGTWGTSAPPMYAQRDTEVRLGENGPRVGVLEKGARVVRWGVGSGAWTQIRIYDLDAHEPPGKAFYVRESDLGNVAP